MKEKISRSLKQEKLFVSVFKCLQKQKISKNKFHQNNDSLENSFSLNNFDRDPNKFYTSGVMQFCFLSGKTF